MNRANSFTHGLSRERRERCRAGAVRRSARRLSHFDPVRGSVVLSVRATAVALAPQLRALGTIEGFLGGAVRCVAEALGAKDSYTGQHSERVGLYAAAMARQLDFDVGDIEDVRMGGELHDVGKIGVPDQLLCKPCPLTFDEYCRVMEHTLIGEQILLPLLPDHPAVLEVVRWHHERFDGSGTPDGLRAEKIPLGVRVVTVADSFDAMTTAREYRTPLSMRAAVRELQDGAGSQFDPDCVQVLLSILRDIAVLTPTAASGACA